MVRLSGWGFLGWYSAEWVNQPTLFIQIINTMPQYQTEYIEPKTINSTSCKCGVCHMSSTAENKPASRSNDLEKDGPHRLHGIKQAKKPNHKYYKTPLLPLRIVIIRV
jgi:hypothetical protein